MVITSLGRCGCGCFHIRSEGLIDKRAVYIDLVFDMNDKEDVLGIYVAENAEFWLSNKQITDHDVKDTLNACGRACFPHAFATMYLYIIHKIRNTNIICILKSIPKLISILMHFYTVQTELTILN